MFVTFEGPEGAGKSTALRTVAEALRASGKSVVTTREPGGTPLGDGIRDLLLHRGHMSAESELFLFLANRADHVQNLILPALGRGDWVLCDRYADSTLVYQAYARGLDEEFVRSSNRIATGGLVPNRTILLDLPPEEGLARLQVKDRLDGESIEFHRKVREGFLREAEREPHRWRVFDARASQDQVALQVIEYLKKETPLDERGRWE